MKISNYMFSNILHLNICCCFFLVPIHGPSQLLSILLLVINHIYTSVPVVCSTAYDIIIDICCNHLFIILFCINDILILNLRNGKNDKSKQLPWRLHDLKILFHAIFQQLQIRYYRRYLKTPAYFNFIFSLLVHCVCIVLYVYIIINLLDGRDVQQCNFNNHLYMTWQNMLLI